MRYRCSVLLILTVLSTSLTGVIVGYDLCVIANVLGDIKKDYKLCNAEARASTDPNPAAGSTKKPSLGCIRSTLVVSALAPGAVVRISSVVTTFRRNHQECFCFLLLLFAFCFCTKDRKSRSWFFCRCIWAESKCDTG